MIPRRRPGQSLAQHQAEMADWLGTDVATMNADHDPLHLTLCAWLGIASQAMRQAAGAELTSDESALAAIEEDAVLHCQRLIYFAAKGPPK